VTSRASNASQQRWPIDPSAVRPAGVCEWLLTSIDVAEGRRRRRARNTSPDNIGLNLKLQVLRDCIADDPEPSELEAWLTARTLRPGEAGGPLRAVCSDILFEWSTALQDPYYRDWLLAGTGDDDADSEP